jgi:YHS domain-containing protein
MEGRPGINPVGVALRSGVTCGDVILLEGDDYIGHCVNVAARLCDHAEGGEVLGDESILSALPAWADVTSSGPVLLRGIGRAVSVARLSSRTASPGDQLDPVCGLPLSASVAERRSTDGLGRPVLFCSESCYETWANRPAPPMDELGSPRQPLIGS